MIAQPHHALDYGDDRSWSDRQLPAVRRWLTTLAPLMLQRSLEGIAPEISFSTAPWDADVKRSTDMIGRLSIPDDARLTGWLKGDPVDVAVRLRRERIDRHFRDWTIRSSRQSGATTELAKLRAGHCAFYLYAWVDAGADNFDEEWILIDIERCRTTGLLDDQALPSKANYDGETSFVSVELCELARRGCLVEMAGWLRGFMRDRVKQSWRSRRRCYCRAPHRCLVDRSKGS